MVGFLVKRIALIGLTPAFLLMYLVGGVMAGAFTGSLAWWRDTVEAWKQQKAGPF